MQQLLHAPALDFFIKIYNDQATVNFSVLYTIERPSTKELNEAIMEHEGFGATRDGNQYAINSKNNSVDFQVFYQPMKRNKTEIELIKELMEKYKSLRFGETTPSFFEQPIIQDLLKQENELPWNN